MTQAGYVRLHTAIPFIYSGPIEDFLAENKFLRI